MSRAPVVEVSDLHKEYVLRGGVVQALKGINLSVMKGEYLSIMGPSGSGKTTLFNMIGGLDKPTKGSVKIDNVELAQMSMSELAWVRSRKIGFIFQTYNLIPVLSASGNVSLPMIFTGMSKSERDKKAVELLTMVGLGDRIDHRPTELSGGQQQRVAIARALANDPSIILADEPTGNLDLSTGLTIVQLLYRLKIEKDTTVICATHDLKMVDVSDRLAWIRDGQIERVERRSSVSITPEDLAV
jgi:putative ABC transport system ATP-binding protein